jgi:hypothetical protein
MSICVSVCHAVFLSIIPVLWPVSMIIALYCADIDVHLDSECAFDIPGFKYEYERRQSKSHQIINSKQ